MTIRLTTPEFFDKVLEKLKQDPLYNEEVNAMFFKYSYKDIRRGVADRTDEYYLDVEWQYDQRVGKVVLTIRYHKWSELLTDEEYLEDESSVD